MGSCCPQYTQFGRQKYTNWGSAAPSDVAEADCAAVAEGDGIGTTRVEEGARVEVLNGRVVGAVLTMRVGAGVVETTGPHPVSKIATMAAA
jgi:hypothetical protein